MRAFRLALAALILAGLAAFALWVEAPPGRIGWDRLRTGVTVIAPAGGPARPAVLLLPGCGGRTEFLTDYADAAARAGAAAIIVDSFAPRGIGTLRALATVCTGMRLRGDSRARDVALVLDNLRDPRLDMGRAALAGWSHGAWAAAAALKDRPDGHPVRAVFLVYPNCRFWTRWPLRAPPRDVAAMAIVPELDPLGDAPACRAALRAAGANVIRVEDATHAFDEPDSLFHLLRFNREAAEANRARFTAFLRDALTGPDGADAAVAPLPAEKPGG